jgi:hypothetical protein
MHVSESAIESRGTAEAPIEVVDITPALLVTQAEERARTATGRAGDPAASVAERYQYRVAPFDVL